MNNKLTDTIKDFPHINSVLVYKNNKKEYEKYFNNTDINTLHNTACIFKGFLATLVGICLDKGYVRLEDKLTDIFKDEVNNASDITLAHVLSKTTGLRWPPPINNVSNEEADISFALNLPYESKPGERFAYKPDPYLIPFIIEKISGKTFVEFLEKELFEKLDIYNYRWNTNFNAREILQLNTRDIAKLGLLYLNNGVYNDQQVISADFIKEATTTKTNGGFPEFKDYGYLWWVTEIEKNKAYFASGFGGQYMCVIPQKNLVITITSKLNKPHTENFLLVKQIANVF